MKNVTLKQLRYFEALAQHEHFGHAAAASSISQPALSVQIKELEEELGAVLFERGPRKVQLTMFGEEFALRVRDILSRVDELGNLARASQERLVGRLRLGVIPTIAPYLLPRIIESLSKSHQGLEIHMRESLTARLLQELSQSRIDAALVALPVSEPSLTEVELFSETFLLVRPEQDANKPVPDTQTLSEQRLLLLEEGHCFRDQALSFCSLQQNLPRDGLDGSSLATLVQMVGAGIGVTLIPQMAEQIETRSARVAVSRLRDPQPTRTIGMIWRKTNPLSEKLMEICEVVRKVADPTSNKMAAITGA